MAKTFLVLIISLIISTTISVELLPLTLRSQIMSKIGRQEWVISETNALWDPLSTGIVIVDMWDTHWCKSAAFRVAEIAIPMNFTLTAARKLGMAIIFAPSDVTEYYKEYPQRKWVKNLPNVTLPQPINISVPTFPLITSTDGGCDTVCPEGHPWTHQIDTLTIVDGDAIISSKEGVAEQELYNIITHKHIKNLIYMGVHENMCIMNRPFAIEKVTSWGWNKNNIAVVRDLVDVMYTPKDPPYVSHDEGLKIHTEYVEKFWANSLSMYDILRIGNQ